MWLAIHEALPIGGLRYNRGLASSPNCPHCLHEEEIVLHNLRDCPKAVVIWQILGYHERRGFFAASNVYDWFSWLIGC